jgi:hypothetical protein
METGDLDGDGDAELVAARVRWFFNSWYLVFYDESRLEVIDPATGTAEHTAFSEGYYGLALTDRNGDGRDEVYLGGFDGSIDVRDGTTWELLASYSVADSPLAGLLFLDIDGDGNDELAFSSILGIGVYDFDMDSVTLYTESEGFTPGAFHSLASHDVDNDGRKELLVGDYNGIFVYGENTPVGVEPNLPSTEAIRIRIYPNPAQRDVEIALTLDHSYPTLRVEVFDLLGRRVSTLHEGPLPAGVHPLRLNSAGMSAGIHIIRVQGEGLSLTQPFTIL